MAFSMRSSPSLRLATSEDAIPESIKVIRDAAKTCAHFGHVRLADHLEAAADILYKRLVEDASH